MNITVRDVDEKVFRRFKAEAVKEGQKLGQAVTRAMKFWLEKKHEERGPAKSLLDLKPIDWGEGTEKTSTEIDSLLYR
ncbi:MAG: hypothetical protein D6733_03835 [Methanobacteriota archaeon]|nr:MAG: hypothetical protein D6733_03835 [Euryarchaeota archaeon]